jgi:hypothetical protein
MMMHVCGAETVYLLARSKTLTPAGMVPTGVFQEEEAMSKHRSLLPRILIIVTIKVKVIIRRW